MASHSFRGRLAPVLAGRQPLPTFVTIGELTQWTKLRNWGPGNGAALESCLSDKPVISAARSIAVIWGEPSAAAAQRGLPGPVTAVRRAARAT